MSSLFGQVWFWSLLAFLCGAILTWVLLVRPAQQRVQQLERHPRGNRPAPTSGPAPQAPPRPGQPSGPPRAAYQPPATPPAWPGQGRQAPEEPEHHPHTRWLERDSLQDAGRQLPPDDEARQAPERVGQVPGQPDPDQGLDQVTERQGGQSPAEAHEQWLGGVTERQGRQTPPQAPDQRPGYAPEQRLGHAPEQREFVRADPPTQFVQPGGYREQEYPEDYDREYQHEYPEDYQQDYPQEYPEDDEQRYAAGYQHAEQAADWPRTVDAPDAAEQVAQDPADPDAQTSAPAWLVERPGGLPGSSVGHRLDDIDEQPELGGLDDFDSGSFGEPETPEPRAGSLFEPSAPADEPDLAYEDNGHEVNGYPGAEDQSATAGGTDTVEPSETDTDADESDEQGAPDTDPVTGLPKRRRGASNRIRGGFAPPRPIEPSIRPVARRTPQRDVSTGSLFEPSRGEQSAGSVAQAAGHAEAAEVPPGPFGPGSAMPLPGGGKPDPSFTVKASVTELRYCTEGSPQFAGMTPEVWFATPSDAERVGFRPM